MGVEKVKKQTENSVKALSARVACFGSLPSTEVRLLCSR